MKNKRYVRKRLLIIMTTGILTFSAAKLEAYASESTELSENENIEVGDNPVVSTGSEGLTIDNESEPIFKTGGDTTWQNDYEYHVLGNEIVLEKYKGAGGNVVVPSMATIGGSNYKTAIYGGNIFEQDNVVSLGFEKGVKAYRLIRVFSDLSRLESIDLSQLDTSELISMSFMCNNCKGLRNINLSGVNTSSVTEMDYIFSGCSGLTSVDVSGFDTSNVTDMGYMFYECSGLTNLDVSGFDTSNVTDMGRMFQGCNNLTSLDVSRFDTTNVTDMSYMFAQSTNLTSLDVSGFDISNVTEIGGMFFDCNKLTDLDVSGFNTSNVINMSGMFEECCSLTGLDVSGFETSNVTNMGQMFRGCSGLTSLDVSGFDTSKVTSMRQMFSGCSKLASLNVSSFDTSNVTDMESMFHDCKELTSLDVSGFNTSNVTNMDDMFHTCSSLTSLDVSGFNTSNVAHMIGMFHACEKLTSLDVSGFNTSNVTHMAFMFGGCSSLKALDLSGLNMSKAGECDDWFNGSDYFLNGCFSLTRLKTPVNNISAIPLPRTMYDKSGKAYDEIPANTTISIELRSDWSKPVSDAGDFVRRLYEVGLGREPEDEGLNNWTNQLTTGEKNAVDIVQGVLCSPEYLNKGKTNGEMVTDCYNAMLGRNPDEAGFNDWTARLNGGMSINAIFAGFVGSGEFAALCADYGINPGTYNLTEERDKNAGVTMFVGRLYTQALGRSFDVDGINGWCGQINANPSKDNIMNVATNGFFHSAEFMGKNLNNKDFVKVLYRTYLGRDYDEAGLNSWVGMLDRGEKTRDEVMEGFAYSQEFTNIMASYGL